MSSRSKTPEVVFVTQEVSKNGGVARVNSYWSNVLGARGFLITLAVSEVSPPFYQLNPDVRIVRFRYAYSGLIKNFISNLIELYKLISKLLLIGKPDFIIFDRSAYIEPLFILRFCFFSDIKFIYFVHGGTSQFRLEYAQSLAGYVRLLLIRLIFARIISLYYDEPPLFQIHQRLSIINNPVMLPLGSRLRRDFKRRVALYVGRIEFEKGVTELLEAWTAIPNRNGWSLWFVGEGSAKVFLQLQVDKLRLDDVYFFNGTPKVGRFYSIASLYVSAASAEGWGLSLLEAMSRGCPIVTFKSAGARFLLNHGEDGFIADQGDINQMSSYIKFLIESPARRLKMGDLAYQKSKKFTTELAYAGWLSLLNRLAIAAPYNQDDPQADYCDAS